MAVAPDLHRFPFSPALRQTLESYNLLIVISLKQKYTEVKAFTEIYSFTHKLTINYYSTANFFDSFFHGSSAQQQRGKSAR